MREKPKPPQRPPGGRRGRLRDPLPLGDLLPRALRALGVPSPALTQRVESAWREACEPGWAERTRLRSLEGGVLSVSVSSEALRGELDGYHRARLLEVLRARLPGVALVGLRFCADGETGSRR